MRRLIDLEDNGDLDTLSKLLDWLVEQKAWELVDELAARYISRFESEPMLLYILAQSQKEQGEAAKAEETAHRAFGLNPGREEMNLLKNYDPLNIMNLYRNMVGGSEEIKLYHRYFIAQYFLHRRGLFDWAKRRIRICNCTGSPHGCYHHQRPMEPIGNVLRTRRLCGSRQCAGWHAQNSGRKDVRRSARPHQLGASRLLLVPQKVTIAGQAYRTHNCRGPCANTFCRPATGMPPATRPSAANA